MSFNVNFISLWHKAGIKVAQYMTELPPREVLIRQVQKSLEAAKAHFDNAEDGNAPALPLEE